MKLRIPIFIFILGVVTGIIQLINNNFSISKTESYIQSIIFFLIIGSTVFVCERKGLNDKRVHFFVGLSLMALGMFIDLITL